MSDKAKLRAGCESAAKEIFPNHPVVQIETANIIERHIAPSRSNHKK